MDIDEDQHEQSYFSNYSITSFFEIYGWYILIGAIAVLCLYEKFIKSIVISLKGRYDEYTYAAKYHKDPDMFEARLVAQQKRTQLLQEKYNTDTQKYLEKQAEKQAEKELKKQGELFKNTDGGQRLGSNSSSSLKPEYNPLMGGGSSSNYRPPKRSACSRGGCG